MLGERLRANALRDWAHPAEIPELRLFLQRLTQRPERFVDIIKCFTVNVMLNTTFAQGSTPSLDNPLIHCINEASEFGPPIHRTSNRAILGGLSTLLEASPNIAARHGLEKKGTRAA
jgi:hypothetical protein